jgi:PAS domain S-box-containing protein
MKTPNSLTPDLLQVFETVPDLYLILSVDLVILTASNAYLEATFTRRQAIVGKYVFDVFPDNPATPHAFAVRNLEASLREVVATRKSHQMALQRYDVPRPLDQRGFEAQSFEEKYWLPLNTAVLDGQGELAYIIHKVEDVTGQQRAERALQAQQELFQTVFEAAPLSLTLYKILYTPTGQVEDFEIRLFNPFTERTTGLTTGQVVGKRYGQVFPTTLKTGVLEVFKQVAQSGESAEFERWYEGESMHHWFRFIANKVDTWLVVITEDITLRKKTEEALALQNVQLTRTNADLDNFIYTASHDLKSPIANIEGLLQQLWRTLPAEVLAVERVERIRTLMQGSLERFKRTIASLTEVVKLQKENSGEAVSVDLARVVEEVLLDLAPLAKEQVEIDLSDCSSIRILEKNLRSVVYNLVSNAIKYRSPERTPRVRIRCESTAEYQVLTVTDNGLGMEEGRMSGLFTMFKRFHDHVEGSGIGLYMVKKMVENAGGKIEVESQLGAGSTFRVYFPR